MKTSEYSTDKILLVMLPFWDPLVPPQGISHLKNFLRHHGFNVKTRDANTEPGFKELYNRYFADLRKYVPEDRQGNFFNIGHDVMRNHMTAHINHENEAAYIELVKTIVYNTFFTPFSTRHIHELNHVLDTFYTGLENYMLRLLEEEKPGVLGISVLRDTIGPSLFGFKVTRERYPHIKTVMGGSIFSDHLLVGTPNFEFFLEKTPYIDKIIVGEGQELFLRLLRGQFPESRRVFTLEDIDRQTLGYSPLNFPDMSDFDVKANYPYLSAQASSSCPFQCSFCNVAAFFGKYREKDAAQTVEEMRTLYDTYGMQVFFMNDALLNNVASGLSGEFIKSDIALYWDGYLRVDDAVGDPEVTLLWRRGGMYRVRLGVESGSQRILDLMGKKITLEQTRASLASLANAGIKTTTYWVIGHPGETEDDFLQTLESLEEFKNYIYEAECNPFIFGYSGQAHSREWEDKRRLLYPEEAAGMLMLQTWTVDEPPTREETYRRVNRFVQHCDKLGIPNPYSLQDIYLADERWRRLHKNAVPALVDFKENGAYIDECKNVGAIFALHNTLQEQGDFDF